MFDGDVIKLLQKFCSKSNVCHTLVLRWSNTRTGAIVANYLCNCSKRGTRSSYSGDNILQRASFYSKVLLKNVANIYCTSTYEYYE